MVVKRGKGVEGGGGVGRRGRRMIGEEGCEVREKRKMVKKGG